MAAREAPARRGRHGMHTKPCSRLGNMPSPQVCAHCVPTQQLRLWLAQMQRAWLGRM